MMNGVRRSAFRTAALLYAPIHHPLPWCLGLVLSEASHPSPGHSRAGAGSPPHLVVQQHLRAPLQLHSCSWVLSPPSLQASLWKMDWMQRETCSFLSFLIAPPLQVRVHTHTHTHTHTCASGKHGWASTNGDTNYPTGTILALFWDLQLLVPHSQAVSHGSLCWALALKLLPKPSWVSLREGRTTAAQKIWCDQSFQQCQCVTVGTGWHHTWPSTGLSTRHSMNFITRTRKYRFDASRKRWLRSHFLGIRQIMLKWVLIIPTDCISRAIPLNEAWVLSSESLFL